MDVDDSTLHCHLSTLVDVGLIEKRKRTEGDRSGFDTYYRSTVLADALLDHGVEELIRREREFAEVYE